METHKDLHCCICTKWLDNKPRACGDRICDSCYRQNEGYRQCPACYEEVTDLSKHYNLDNFAKKEMEKKIAPCKLCNAEMLMCELRDHEEKCGTAEVHEVPVLASTQAEVAQHLQVVPAPINCFRTKLPDGQLGIVRQRKQEMGAVVEEIGILQEQIPEIEPVLIKCPHQIFGCPFKASTQAEVEQHLQVVPAPINCFRTKLLDRQLGVVRQQQQEIRDVCENILEQLRNFKNHYRE